MKTWLTNAERMQALDRALQGGPAQPRTPADLHGSIMRALETARRPARPAGLWRFAVPALALVWLAAGWWYSQRATRPTPLGPPATALVVGAEWEQTMPSAVMAPLWEEWRQVNRSVTNTVEFLIAALP